MRTQQRCRRLTTCLCCLVAVQSNIAVDYQRLSCTCINQQGALGRCGPDMRKTRVLASDMRQLKQARVAPSWLRACQWP